MHRFPNTWLPCRSLEEREHVEKTWSLSLYPSWGDEGELGRRTVAQSIVSHFQFFDRTIVRKLNFYFVAQCFQNSSCQEKQYWKYNEKYIIENKNLYYFDLSVLYIVLHGDILHFVKNIKAVQTKRRALQKAPCSGYGICWNFWISASSILP